MDLLANLTALSPPGDTNSAARAAAAMRSKATMTHTRTDASTGRTHDQISAEDNTTMDGLEPCESASSVQCSADPTAFAGFQSRLSTPTGSTHTPQRPHSMRLALDLGSSASERGFRPQGVSISQLSQNTSYSQQQQFTELLYGDDTQDDASIAALDVPHEDVATNDNDDAAAARSADPSTPRPTPTFVTRGAAEQPAASSPAAPNFLFAMESAVRARQAAKSSSAENAMMDRTRGSKAVETPVVAVDAVSSENDDLSLTTPVTTRSAPAQSIVRDVDVVVIDDDDDEEEKEEETGASCPPVFTSDVTDELAHLEPMQWFSAEDTPEGIDEESSSSGDAMHRARSDSTESFPDTQSLGDTEGEEDATEDVDMDASINTVSEEDMELQSLGDTEDVPQVDDEEESPTHPSSSDLSTRTMSPVPDGHGKVAPSPGRAALKKRSTLASHALPALSDVDSQEQQLDGALVRPAHMRAAAVAACTCSRGMECQCSGAKAPAATKLSSASRNLAMSFALPDSQESASQSLDDGSARSTAAPSASVSRLQEAHVDRASSLSSLSLPPLARASPAKRAMPLARAPVASSSLKRSAAAPSEAVTPSPASAGTSSTESTPTRRKRARSAPSPDVGTLDALTPVRSTDATPTRRSMRTSPATGYDPSSSASLRTPVAMASVRTRARGTPLVPSHRPVAARARTIFKYKFEFCVTGFVESSKVLVVAMIEEHGGKIVDQPRDVLHRASTKAVVIATAGSWRKLKFMYAVARGIPVVHPEWLRACIKAGQAVPFDGYCVPSGYSVRTRKFECLPVRALDIFAGMSFGIPYDVADDASGASVRGLGSIIVYILKSCGAARVIEDLAPSHECDVDVVLSDELTKTCKYYQRTHHVPVKSFAWVTECMILQQLVDPRGKAFKPQKPDAKYQLAASAQIGDIDRSTLKLHPGELVLADLAKQDIDSFLIFHVCEILRIRLKRRRGSSEPTVLLEVGVLERSPNSPKLTGEYTKTITIPASYVKKRVVAVAKEDFLALEYQDETMFYYEDAPAGASTRDDDDASDDDSDDEDSDDDGSDDKSDKSDDDDEDSA